MFSGCLKINKFDLQPNKEVAPSTFKKTRFVVSDKTMKIRSVKRINVKQHQYGSITNITIGKRRSSEEIHNKVILTLNESDPIEPDNFRQWSKSKQINQEDAKSSKKSSNLESERMKNTPGDNIINTNKCNFRNVETDSTSRTISSGHMSGKSSF